MKGHNIKQYINKRGEEDKHDLHIKSYSSEIIGLCLDLIYFCITSRSSICLDGAFSLLYEKHN